MYISAILWTSNYSTYTTLFELLELLALLEELELLAPYSVQAITIRTGPPELGRTQPKLVIDNLLYKGTGPLLKCITTNNQNFLLNISSLDWSEEKEVRMVISVA